MKKKLTLLCLGLLLGVLTVMAQETIHVVKRGETLTMIATQYGVSVDALKEANPLAGKTLFVGMKLQIPEKAATAPTVSEQPQELFYAEKLAENKTETTQMVQTVNADSTKESILDYKKAQGTINTYLRMMFYFTDNAFGGSDSENGIIDFKSDFALAWDIGANYYFVKSAFVYAGLGVVAQGGTYSNSTGYGSTTRTTNTRRTILRLPLGAGYNYPFTENIGITVQTGPMLNYLIAGYEEQKESGKRVSKTKLKDMEKVNRFSAEWSASIGIILWEFEIGAEYCIGLDKHAADIWGVYLGYRF